MSEQQNLDLVNRAYAAFGRGDMAALLDCFDEQVEWITPGPDDLPTAGHRRGREAVSGFFRTLDELFEFQRFEPATFVAQGDVVVVIGSDTVRVKATGTVIDFEWVHVSTCANGRVVKFQEFGDVSALVADLRGAATARA
jgi:ketosteroid isomerase-like protein